MDMQEAVDVIGINAMKIPTRNMARALGMLTWNNTPADWKRKEAAEFVLKRWSAYQAECNRRRDLKFARR